MYLFCMRLRLDQPPYYSQLKFVCFYLWYVYDQPVGSHHQHRPTVDMKMAVNYRVM
jgi:hypothetical protein